jgi:hypothetical protein
MIPVNPILNAGSATGNPLPSYLAPTVFLINGAEYMDITDDYSVTVEENPAALVIDGDMGQLQAWLQGGATLVITAGLRESVPLMASWQADPATWARDVPRVLTKVFPHLEQWAVIAGTVLGVDTPPVGSHFVTQATDKIVVDDSAKLFDLLAFMRAFCGNAAVGVSWRDRSRADFGRGAGSFRPGALLTTAHRGDVAVDANAVITGRRIHLLDDGGFGTSYTTQRIMPDIDAMDAHPRLFRVVRSRDERLAEE